MGNFEAKETSTGKGYLNGQREKKQFSKTTIKSNKNEGDLY